MLGQQALVSLASFLLATAVLLAPAGQVSFAAGGPQIAPTAHFTDPDGVVGDNFGYSVALSADGSTVLIGASSAMVNGVSVGKAYIFSKVNSIWSTTPAATFAYPGSSGNANDFFGSAVALSEDGSVALISAPGMEQVYVYHRSNGLWSSSPIATLNNPDPADGGAYGDCFGCAIALSSNGSVAFVGVASAYAGGVPGTGKSYVFAQSNGAWSKTPVASFTDPGTAQDDQFGYGVALSGDGATALVGTAQLFTQQFGNSRAFIFTETNGNWLSTPSITFTDPNGTNEDWFGSAVALSSAGSTALIGADRLNSSSGAAYLFTSVNNSWSTKPTQIFSDPDMKAEDFFGDSVAVSADGTIELIGASGASVNGAALSGKAYIYKETNGLWTVSPVAILVDPNAGARIYDAFGTSVAMSAAGDTVLVGAPQTPGASPPPPNQIPTHGGPGQAYIYQTSDRWGNPNPPPPGGSGGGGSFGWLALVVLCGLLTRRKYSRLRKSPFAVKRVGRIHASLRRKVSVGSLQPIAKILV